MRTDSGERDGDSTAGPAAGTYRLKVGGNLSERRVATLDEFHQFEPTCLGPLCSLSLRLDLPSGGRKSDVSKRFDGGVRLIQLAREAV